MRPGCGEYALNAVFHVGAWAKKPLVYRLPTLEVPASFFYGEFDWMDASNALVLTENN